MEAIEVLIDTMNQCGASANVFEHKIKDLLRKDPTAFDRMPELVQVIKEVCAERYYAWYKHTRNFMKWLRKNTAMTYTENVVPVKCWRCNGSGGLRPPTYTPAQACWSCKGKGTIDQLSATDVKYKGRPA